VDDKALELNANNPDALFHVSVCPSLGGSQRRRNDGSDLSPQPSLPAFYNDASIYLALCDAQACDELEEDYQPCFVCGGLTATTFAQTTLWRVLIDSR
jgi:hypothetical protein